MFDTHEREQQEKECFCYVGAGFLPMPRGFVAWLEEDGVEWIWCAGELGREKREWVDGGWDYGDMGIFCFLELDGILLYFGAEWNFVIFWN